MRGYAAAVHAGNLQLLQFPIIEMAAPEDPGKACLLVEDVAGWLQQGLVVAMHCK